MSLPKANSLNWFPNNNGRFGVLAVSGYSVGQTRYSARHSGTVFAVVDLFHCAHVVKRFKHGDRAPDTCASVRAKAIAHAKALNKSEVLHELAQGAA